MCLNVFFFMFLFVWKFLAIICRFDFFFLLCLHVFMFFITCLYVWLFSNILACQPPLCAAGWKERLGLPLLGNDNPSSTSQSFASYENCPLSFASSLQPTRILPPGILGLSTFVFRSEKNCLFVSNQEQWALHVTSLAKCSSTVPLCSCGPDWSNHRPTHSVPRGPE